MIRASVCECQGAYRVPTCTAICYRDQLSVSAIATAFGVSSGTHRTPAVPDRAPGARTVCLAPEPEFGWLLKEIRDHELAA